MSEDPTGVRLEEIRARAAAAIHGPWRWFGNADTDQIYLGTPDRGRLFIMSPSIGWEQYVFDAEALETYTLEEARQLDPPADVHADAWTDFLVGHLDPEEGPRYLAAENGPARFIRGARPTIHLAFAGNLPPEGARDGKGRAWDRHVVGGYRMTSHRELARYEVLGGRTLAEHLDEGGHEDDLYRRDLVGIDTPEADFIAHARADIDFLLAEIDRLTEGQ